MTIKKLLLSLIALCFSAASFALSLDDAKDQGLVGENLSGYLTAISVTPEVTALVEEINAKRKQAYQKLANDNNLTLAAVEQMAGQKAVEKSKSGHMVNLGQGWQKKP